MSVWQKAREQTSWLPGMIEYLAKQHLKKGQVHQPEWPNLHGLSMQKLPLQRPEFSGLFLH
jgi:hypothetical protein